MSEWVREREKDRVIEWVRKRERERERERECVCVCVCMCVCVYAYKKEWHREWEKSQNFTNKITHLFSRIKQLLVQWQNNVTVLQFISSMNPTEILSRLRLFVYLQPRFDPLNAGLFARWSCPNYPFACFSNEMCDIPRETQILAAGQLGWWVDEILD